MDNRNMMKSYLSKTVCLGEKYTLGYAIYLMDKSGEIDNIKEPLQTRLLSFIHDVPLYPTSKPIENMNIINMIVEIPRFTTEKMEIVTTADNNPIMYDLKDGQIRNVTYQAKSAEKSGYPFHYGAIPQTWENSLEIDHRTGLLGDDDPLDCFDISLIPASTGSVRHVKVLGAIAMIDDGMTDWKLVGINTDDPMANLYDDIDQVPVAIMDQIIDFLKFYKLPNVTQFDKKMIWNAEESMEIVRSLHNEWIRHKNPRSV